MSLVYACFRRGEVVQVFIEGGVAAFRNEHTLVWLLASASRAESEAIGCEIYFGRVVNTPTL